MDIFNEDYKKQFSTWLNSELKGKKVKDNLSIDAQIKNASKKLDKAVKKENYEKAAKYRDLLIELKNH